MPKKKKSRNKDPERSLRNRRLALACLVGTTGIGAFVGAAAGLDALNQRAIDHLTPGNPSVAIAWPAGPDGSVWLPQTERDRVAALIRDAALGGRALSREPLARIGETLRDTGWFQTDPHVRWTAEGSIEVTGDWRVPAAAVRVGQREDLVDSDAHRLPLDYAAGASNLVAMTNPSQPRPAVGAVWQGQDLRDAMDLMLMLQRERLLEQVAGIDLGAEHDNGRLTVVTDRGAQVVWGGGPERVRPGEQPTSVKLNRLRSLLERTGRIDGGVDRIDLRGQQILLERRPG